MSRDFCPTAYNLDEHADGYFLLPLGDGGADAPVALLSSLAAGDMTFRPTEGNPTRDEWLRRRNFDPARSLAVTLAHSRDVIVARSPAGLAGVRADGILSDEKNACAVVTVADCMPIFLFDRASGAFGALHSGWKGTGILAEAFRLLSKTWGTKASDVHVTFGPCIGTCCYPVDEARAASFSMEFGEGSVTRIDGAPRLNLLSANLALAERLGAASVRYTSACTSCEPRLGSYRRQGEKSFTRMAACVGYPGGAS